MVLLLALAGSACETTDKGSAPATSAATIAPPATTEAANPAEQAVLTNAVSRYWAVYSSIYNDPRQDLAIVATVAGGEEAASLRDQAGQLAAQGIVSVGAVTVARLTVGSLTPSPVAGGPTTANVTTCNDVSSVSGVDPSGASVVDPNRLPQTQAAVRLQNSTPDDPAGWRVIQVRTGPTVPCGPS